MNKQAVKARKITEPVLVFRTAANHPSITNDLAAAWTNFGETRNMLQKVEDKTSAVSSPPKLVHLHKQSVKRKNVQFSHSVKQSPNNNETIQTNNDLLDSSIPNNSVVDGDYLNNEMCVMNANSQEVMAGNAAKAIDQSSPLDMEPLRSGSSSSREDEHQTTAPPYQMPPTLHSNKGAIFGPPINFDKVSSTASDHPPVVTSAPSVPPVTVLPVAHHIPLRKFQIPESALANLKKTIEKQKIDVQASGIKLESVTTKMEPLIADSGEESSVTAHNNKPVCRKLHQTYDPVVATNGAAPSGNCRKKRKIAVAPSPLNYIQAQPIKHNSKQPHLMANSSERPPAIKTQQQKSKPTVRKIAKPSEQSSQKNHLTQATAITPSSWKAGRDTVHRILGPPKKPTKPPKQPQDHDLTAGDSSSSIASSTGSLGLPVKSKQPKLNAASSSPSKESMHIPLLNANAATILSELGLSEEDGHPAPKSNVQPTKRPMLGAPKVFNPDPPPVIPRVRHYDAEKVREYMEKKREARKKKDIEQRYVMQRAEMEKRKKLESLDEGRKQALHNNLRRAEMKRQHQIFQQINQQPGIHVHLEEANADSDKENRLQSSPPAKKHRGAFSTRVFDSSSLLDTLALSGNKYTMPQSSPPNQTLSESVSNQRPITSIPTAQSLRTTWPVSKTQEPPTLSSSVDSISKGSIPCNFPSQENLPDPVVVTKSKLPPKSPRVRSADSVVTSNKLVRTNKRPNVTKSQSATFNTKDLPGVHNVDAHVFKAAQQRRQEEAVKRIQAAYRGHQVRKSLHWNHPSTGSHQKPKTQMKHVTPHSPHHINTANANKQKLTTSAVKSRKPAKKTVSPQQGKATASKKVTTPVTDKVSHKTIQEVDSDGGYPSGPTAVPPWEQTGGDKMSVINIYTRQYEKLQEQFNATAVLHAERCKEAFSSTSLTSGSQQSLTGKATSLLEQVQEEGVHMEYTPLYSESFEVASTDDHEVVTSTTAAGGGGVTSQSKSLPVDATNVVTASSLSEGSFDPDSLQTPAEEENGTSSTNSLSCISPTDTDQYSQTASITQESPHKSDSHDVNKATKSHLPADTQPPLKYSPSSLELKLNAELALLESVSDSLQQLNNVEGARAISTAQQETAGLAHILKTRQQAHELEMKTMAQKAHDEVLQAKQQLQQMQQSAAEKYELFTKQALHQSMEQQKKIDKIQREAEEAQQMLSTHAGALQHTATQTATPYDSINTNTATSSAVTGGSSVSTSVSSHNKQSSSHTSLATSPIPTYISDFEDNTIPTATGPPLGVSMATTVGSGDSHGDTKKDAVVTVTDHVSEDISSEGDTLVEQLNNSQLDSTTLKDGMDSAIMDSDVEDDDGDDSVSFRMVLPSESHRKQSRDRLRSASESVSSLATSHGDLSGLEPHGGSSDGEESFCDFVSRMVRQYMLEEETRAQHQQALLKLREQALQEKNKLEMQWLNIKQQKLRNKGDDDRMPPLKKKQREVMRKFQHERAEIQRLQEASKQASQERKMLLKQQEDINKIRKSTQAYKDKLRQLRGNHDVSLSSLSSVSAVSSSDSGDSLTAKKSISKPTTEIPSTSTPSSSHKSAKQLSITEQSIKEDISGQQYDSTSGHPIKTVTSFPTYSPVDTQEVLSISGMSTDREDEGKYSSVQDDHTSTDKDVATSTDSIPKQLKKLKISEKYLTQREKKVLKHKEAAEAALKKQQELMLREQEITKQEEEVNRIINQAMECFYQRKEVQKSRLTVPTLDSLDVSSVLPATTEQEKKSLKDGSSSVPEDLSDVVDQQTVKTSTVTQAPQVVTELYGNESFETLEVTSQLHTAATIPTAIISSTPRSNDDNQKATISDVSDSLKMSDTLTETATTATSEASTDIEVRIKVLKEQLKRRREEVKKSQQEQKRKKKALLKQKEEELKRKLQAVEVRATAMKEMTMVASSEGSADVSESDMEERSRSKQEKQQTKLQPVSTVDSEMHGYTPFSEATPAGTEQMTTVEVSTALVLDTSQDPTTAVVATAVDVSQLSAPPDEVPSDVTVKSSTPVSLTSSTVSVDHSSALCTEEDIADGESVVQLDDTLTKPLLSQHEDDQLSYTDQQHQIPPLDDQHKEDQLPPQDHRHDKQSHDVDQVPHDLVDETLSKTMTAQYDETFETYDDSSIKTDGIGHSRKHDDIIIEPEQSTTSQEQKEIITEFDDSTIQEHQTSLMATHSVITQQETSVKTRSVSSPEQLQSPVEAKLPLKASEVELSDSQPATEVSEASSIAESNEVLSIEHDDTSSFKIGGRVLIGQKMSGTIRFVGQTIFAPGTWIGVELDLAKGTNDGSLDDVRYFTCEPSHGLFAPPSKVEIQSEVVADTTPVTVTPSVEPSKIRQSPEISPVATATLSDKAASDDEATQPAVSEMDKVEDITTGLVSKLADEAVHEMTAIWSNRPLAPVIIQKEAQDTVSSQDAVVSKVTDELFALLLRSEVEMMCKINDKKETTIKTPTKLKLSPKPLVDHTPIVTPPSPFHLENKIPTAEELTQLRSLAVDPARVDSPPRQQQTARVMAGDISPPHSPPLSPIATNVRPLSESRSSSIESITQLLESHPVDTSRFLIPNNRETVNKIVASAWNACHQLSTEELHSNNIPASSEVMQLLQTPPNLSEEEQQCLLAYQELVFELGVEVIRELRPYQHKPRPVWMPPQPVSLSRDPVNLERVQSIVFTKLMKGQIPFTLPVARYIHAGRRVCGREIDFVEALLIKELRSEEKEWTNYDEDEELVKIQTADAVLELLLTDTINVMNNVVSRRSTKSMTP